MKFSYSDFIDCGYILYHCTVIIFNILNIYILVPEIMDSRSRNSEI